jgi:hypothetical protein
MDDLRHTLGPKQAWHPDDMRAVLGPFARPAVGATAAVIVLLLSGCAGEPPTSPPAGVDELEVPTPALDADDYVEGIDNPWLPLVPGNQWVYRSRSEDGEQQITVTVLEETREISGVDATVVHDVVTDAAGRVIEDTYDWYAQDHKGNVWYLGEDTTEYAAPGGPEASKAGSWEAGVDGARAGIAMLASPRVGDGYRMEFLEGEAEDQARIVRLDARATVPFGSWQELLETEETTPLEPELIERKFYAQDIGLVRERTLAGGGDVVELISFAPSAGPIAPGNSPGVSPGASPTAPATG